MGPICQIPANPGCVGSPGVFITPGTYLNENSNIKIYFDKQVCVSICPFVQFLVSVCHKPTLSNQTMLVTHASVMTKSHRGNPPRPRFQGSSCGHIKTWANQKILLTKAFTNVPVMTKSAHRSHPRQWSPHVYFPVSTLLFPQACLSIHSLFSYSFRLSENFLAP